MAGTVASHSPIDKALALAERGFHVFPCKINKAPACAHGHNDATDDPVVIRMLFARPDAQLVGIACPQSHIHVLDIDRQGLSFYEQNKHLIPPTVTITSRTGGLHLPFRADDPSVIVKQGANGGIDVRSGNVGHGGYVIAWGEASDYDRNRMSGDWPEAFVALARARPRTNGTTTWLQPPTTPVPSQISIGQSIADEIRAVAVLGHVPIGERDNFLIRAYGHAQKAHREGMATLEQVGAFIGRISSIKMMSGDQVKKFPDKLKNVGFTPQEIATLLPYENWDDGAPIEPFRKGGEFTPVSDPFEGIPGGETGFGEPNPFDRQPTTFTFESGDTLVFDPAAQASLVSGVLPLLGTGALSGKPAAKKSFIAIDFAACVAGNKPWGGRDVTSGLVIYIAAEGQGGMNKRMTACFAKRGLTPGERANVKLLRVAPNLGVRGGDAVALAGAVRVVAGTEPVRMIVIDTLVRTLGGAEENGMGMASFMDNATQISTALSTFVLAVHHPSKAGEVLRGHTSLEGGLDLVLAVSSEKGLLESQMFVHKDKDGEDGVTHVVEFEKVVLGTDKQGQPVSTLVVKAAKYLAGAGASAPAGVSVNLNDPATWVQVLDIVHEHEEAGTPALANPQGRDKWLNRIVELRTRWEGPVVAKVVGRLTLKGWIVRAPGVSTTRKSVEVYVLSAIGKQQRKRFSAPHTCATEFDDQSSGAQS